MIIKIIQGTPHSKIEELCNQLQTKGVKVYPYLGEHRSVIGLIGDLSLVDFGLIKDLAWVEDVQETSMPFKLVSREFHPEIKKIKLKNGVCFDDKSIAMIAGPCSVESKEQIFELAEVLSNMGIKVLRGGAWKPRTSPYAFQGNFEIALSWMREAADKFDMAIVTELVDPRQIPLFEDVVDIIQIGARNMYNYALLKEIGYQKKPVMLKRGMNATINEFLLSAEYIASSGNRNIILCERGIRTFERQTKYP